MACLQLVVTVLPSLSLRALLLVTCFCPGLSFQTRCPSRYPVVDNDIPIYRHQGLTDWILYSSSGGDTGGGNNTEKTPVDCLNDAMGRMHILQQIPAKEILRKQSIRIGPSSIDGAGTGVFATKNIKAGTVIGFYPVHAIGLERFDTNTLATATEKDQAYFDQQSSDSEQNDDNAVMNENVAKDTNHNYLHYLIGSRPLCGYQGKEEDGTLFIDVNPNRSVRDAWISHFINDGAVVESNTEEGLQEYYQTSQQRKNCVCIPFGPAPILCTVTTRKVKKGEELFTTYGGSYWLDSLLQLSAEDSDDEEDPIDISDEVQLLAKRTAKNIFDAMQQAQVAHASLQSTLEQLFHNQDA